MSRDFDSHHFPWWNLLIPNWRGPPYWKDSQNIKLWVLILPNVILIDFFTVLFRLFNQFLTWTVSWDHNLWRDTRVSEQGWWWSAYGSCLSLHVLLHPKAKSSRRTTETLQTGLKKTPMKRSSRQKTTRSLKVGPAASRGSNPVVGSFELPCHIISPS